MPSFVKKNSPRKNTSRRAFLNSMTAGAVAFGLPSALNRERAQAKPGELYQDASALENWFNKITGKHKIVFDAVSANEGYPIIWPYTFMSTNNATGTPDSELSVVVILRSKAIPLAFTDASWSKYKLGKLFKLVDYTTNSASERNLYWSPKPGEMPEEGMAIKALQERGVMFCVCETAIGMTTRQYARTKGIDPLEVKKDWLTGLIPGVQLVPSGVWAVNRAQEHGCTYCSVG